MTKISEALSKAADYVAGGWCRYQLGDGCGNYCLNGAINMALYGDYHWSHGSKKFTGPAAEAREAARKVIQENWPTRPPYLLTTALFNNCVAETKEDVIMVLQKAAANMAAEGK